MKKMKLVAYALITGVTLLLLKRKQMYGLLKHNRIRTFYSKGFTLSELLIAIAILGVIAAFTLVKVLQVTDTAQNKAKFKEALATLNQPLFEGVQSGAINPNYSVSSNNGEYILSKILGNKVCPSNSQSEGCAPSSQTGYPFDLDEPGVVLHNGVMMYGFNNNLYGVNGVVLDANGETGPNTVGQDQLVMVYCYDPLGCDSSSWIEAPPLQGGKVSYMWHLSSPLVYREANKALFLSLFQ
jgi:prepilin-type N-terminal cleavage/methylation domain-containing protein